MALIICPDCGKHISTKAAACPNCGCPIQDVIKQDDISYAENVQNHNVQCEKCGTWNTVGTTYCRNCGKIITGKDYTYTTKRYEEIAPHSRYKATTVQKHKEKIPFYATTWFILIMLCSCCFPLGIFLMWRYKTFKKPIRVAITAFFAIAFVVSVIFPSSSREGYESTKQESFMEINSDISDLETSKHETYSVSEATIDETAEPIISEDEFKALCQEIGYKTLLRNPNDYIGEKIVIVAKVHQIMQGGFFDNGQYYRVLTDSSGYGLYLDDEYFMYDNRSSDNMKILQDDVIKIYAEFVGMETIKRALTGAKEEIPAIRAYYIELISE